MSTIRYLAEHGLAFRGSDENINSLNNGNYLGIFEWFRSMIHFLKGISKNMETKEADMLTNEKNKTLFSVSRLYSWWRTNRSNDSSCLIYGRNLSSWTFFDFHIKLWTYLLTDGKCSCEVLGSLKNRHWKLPRSILRCG